MAKQYKHETKTKSTLPKAPSQFKCMKNKQVS